MSTIEAAVKPFVGMKNMSIHPRRPRLKDLGISVPKDSDGAYRAENRKDGKVLNLGIHSKRRGLAHAALAEIAEEEHEIEATRKILEEMNQKGGV